MEDLITRKARLNEAFEQNYFITEKAMIIKSPFSKPELFIQETSEC